MKRTRKGLFSYTAREKQTKFASGLERLADVLLANKTSEPGPSGVSSDGEIRALGQARLSRKTQNPARGFVRYILIDMTTAHRGFSSVIFILILTVAVVAVGGYYLSLKETSTVSLLDQNQALSSTEWIKYPGNDSLEGITFEYPSDWEVVKHGTNTSDDGTSAIRVWKGEQNVLFISSTKAGRIPGCEGVTSLDLGTSEIIDRIRSSAQCGL